MRDILVEIDEGSGCCFGVVNATQKAENTLEKEGILFSLGDIVHNSEEVSRLSNKGLKSIDNEQFEQLANTKVLIRAHGEPPSTYQKAKERGIQLVDATCPVVLKLQKRIAEAYMNCKNNTQMVIYGKRGHAEVVGLVGQTAGEAIVIENCLQLDKLDFTKNILLFSQTTQSIDGFKEIVATIKGKIANDVNFDYKDTICRQIANRTPRIKAFALNHEVVFF